jgi:hypothetical protein
MAISGIRALNQYSPTEEDMRRVAALAGTDCPRRYCWWWHSLAFDWKLTPTEGCALCLLELSQAVRLEICRSSL